MSPDDTENLALTFKSFPKIPGTYAVGGSIRDILLDRPPADFDMVVLGDAYGYAQRLAQSRQGHLVVLGKEGQRLFRVFCNNRIVDIVPASGNSIEADLSCRDFTINAMAYDIITENIVDTTGAMKDLERGILRMVSESAFEADPLRLIRAYRIGAELGFGIDTCTASAVARHAAKLMTVAGERIRTEWLRMLKCSSSLDYLLQMADSGLLFVLFPQLGALKACTQNGHHRHDAYHHTMAAYNHLENLLHDSGISPADPIRSMGWELDPDRKALLKYSLLLHDIGKPATKQVNGDGKIHFYGHEKRGGEMASSICRAMKMSRDETRYIIFMIRRHLYPLMLFTGHSAGTLTRKGRTRFFIKCGNAAKDLLLQSLADVMGKGIGQEAGVASYTDFVQKMLDLLVTGFNPAKNRPPLITGRDLISRFGLSPSPIIGQILSRVEESRLSGQINSRKEALEMAATCLEKLTNAHP